MPCVFCLAVLAIAAGALSATALDEVEARLEEVAADPVERSVDTDATAVFETVVEAGGRRIPIRVTVYKEHGRVRIQILTHELSREEAEALQDRIAAALGAEVVSRSDEASEAKVREASDEPNRPTRGRKRERSVEDPREQRRSRPPR